MRYIYTSLINLIPPPNFFSTRFFCTFFFGLQQKKFFFLATKFFLFSIFVLLMFVHTPMETFNAMRKLRKYFTLVGKGKQIVRVFFFFFKKTRTNFLLLSCGENKCKKIPCFLCCLKKR